MSTIAPQSTLTPLRRGRTFFWYAGATTLAGLPVAVLALFFR